MAQITQNEKLALAFTFDALMDKVRKNVMQDASFPGNTVESAPPESSPMYSISPPSQSFLPEVGGKGVDQQHLCAFLSILTKLEIISSPPYTTKYASFLLCT